MKNIEIIQDIAAMQQRSARIRRQGKTIAFVPTMGFLHEGHLSLIRKARQLAHQVVVSIFVNPTQFGPNEDFEAYPRDSERDLAACRSEKADVVFLPNHSALYPQGYETYVSLERLPAHLCGLSRPLFFRGVATVVTKLFNIVQPQFAVFGEKDFQQLQVIRRFVQDLNFDIEIVGGPTVRESDGVAMSSRNSYLSAEQRPAARSLSQALEQARRAVAGGQRDAAALCRAAAETIRCHRETDIDYIAICDPRTLEDVTVIDRPVVMALAVKVGTTRLIDNMVLDPPGTAPESSPDQ